MLKFSRRFTQAQQDPHLEDTLLTECNGILRWMVEGAQKYLADGIKPSKSMQAELRTYRQDSDLVGEFLADKTRFDSSAQVPQQLLFSRYSHWRMESCVRPISKKQFTQRLMERGFSEAKSGSNRYYVGLALHEGGGGGVLPTRGGNLDMLDGMSTTSGKVPI